MNNSSFYAGPKGQDIIISKIFSNKVEMDADLTLKDNSEVAIGDLVLISYGEYGTENFKANVDLDANKYNNINYNAYVYEKKYGIINNNKEEFYYSFIASLIPSQIPVNFIMNNNMNMGGLYNVELTNMVDGKQSFKLTLPPPLFEIINVNDAKNTANLQVTVNGRSQDLGNIRGVKGDKGDPSGFNIIGKIDDITIEGDEKSIIDPSVNSQLKEKLDGYFNNTNNFNGNEVVVANAIFPKHFETIYYYRINEEYVYSRISAQAQDYSYHDSTGIIFKKDGEIPQTFISNGDDDKGVIYSNKKIMSGQNFYIPILEEDYPTEKNFTAGKVFGVLYEHEHNSNFTKENKDGYHILTLDFSKLELNQYNCFYLGSFGFYNGSNFFQNSPEKYSYYFDFEINVSNWHNENQQKIGIITEDSAWLNHTYNMIDDLGQKEWEKIQYFRSEFNNIEDGIYFPLYLKIFNLSENFDKNNQKIKIRIPETLCVRRSNSLIPITPLNSQISSSRTRFYTTNDFIISLHNESNNYGSPMSALGSRSLLRKIYYEDDINRYFVLDLYNIGEPGSCVGLRNFKPKTESWKDGVDIQLVPKPCMELIKSKVQKDQKPSINHPGLISLSDIQRLDELYDYYKVSKKQIIYNSEQMNFTWDTTNKILGTDINYSNFYNFLPNNSTNSFNSSNFYYTGFNNNYIAKNQEQGISRNDLYTNVSYNNGFMEFQVPNILNLNNYNKIYIEVLFTRRKNDNNSFPSPSIFLSDKDNRIIKSMPQQTNTANLSKFFIILEKISKNTNDYVIFSEINNYSGIMINYNTSLQTNYLYSSYGTLPVIDLNNSSSVKIYLRASTGHTSGINYCQSIPEAFKDMQIIVRGEN